MIDAVRLYSPENRIALIAGAVRGIAAIPGAMAWL